MYFLCHRQSTMTTTMRMTTDKGSARRMKSSNESPLRAAMSIPIGFPKTVDAEPILVARTEEITSGTGVMVRILQRSNITVTITMVELTSPINPDRAKERTITTINSTDPLNSFMLQNRRISQ